MFQILVEIFYIIKLNPSISIKVLEIFLKIK